MTLGPRLVRPRPWWEVRWRQLRHPPAPIVRAVSASVVAAVVLVAFYLAYDWLLRHGAVLPGGDLRLLGATLYVLGVVVVGSGATYLLVWLPAGSGGQRRRTLWSAGLGLLTALPVAYLVFVAATELLRPLLG